MDRVDIGDRRRARRDGHATFSIEPGREVAREDFDRIRDTDLLLIEVVYSDANKQQRTRTRFSVAEPYGDRDTWYVRYVFLFDDDDDDDEPFAVTGPV